MNSPHTGRVRDFSPIEKIVELYIAIDKQGWVKKVNSTHTRTVRVFSPNGKIVDSYIAIDKQGWVERMNSPHTRKASGFFHPGWKNSTGKTTQ